MYLHLWCGGSTDCNSDCPRLKRGCGHLGCGCGADRNNVRCRLERGRGHMGVGWMVWERDIHRRLGMCECLDSGGCQVRCNNLGRKGRL